MEREGDLITDFRYLSRMRIDHDTRLCERLFYEDGIIGFDGGLFSFLRGDRDSREVATSLGLLIVDVGVLDSSLGCVRILHTIAEVSREVDDLIILVDDGDRRCIECRFKR